MRTLEPGNAPNTGGVGHIHNCPAICLNRHSKSGFTLAEVVVSIAIMMLVFCSIILTYVETSYRAEWSGYSLAAQSLSLAQLEQARSGIWDNSLNKNDITNIGGTTLTNWTWTAGTGGGTGKGWTSTTLDLPISGSNVVTATNFVTIKMMYLNGVTNPPIQIQMVTVDTVWPFSMFGKMKLYTNRTASMYGMDNRDDTSL